MATAINRTAVLDRTADDFIDQVYADQLATQQDEARSRPPAPLRVTSRYLFRSRPGTLSNFALAIPRQTELTRDERLDRRNQERWDGKYDAAAQEELDELYRILGDYQIKFTPIVGKGECFFATDEPLVAAYVRGAIARGGDLVQHLYEESPGEPIVVGDQMFPGTAVGALAAERYRVALATADEPVSASIGGVAPASQPKRARTVEVATPPAGGPPPVSAS